jgi:hypothetical protein
MSRIDFPIRIRIRLSVSTSTKARVISCPFDKYEIKILLSPSNQFIGIQEVSLRRDFRSYEQRAANIGVHEVGDFYKD